MFYVRLETCLGEKWRAHECARRSDTIYIYGFSVQSNSVNRREKVEEGVDINRGSLWEVCCGSEYRKLDATHTFEGERGFPGASLAHIRSFGALRGCVVAGGLST